MRNITFTKLSALVIFTMAIVLLCSVSSDAATRYDWPDSPTNRGVVVENGHASGIGFTDTQPGTLFVGYFKLSGRSTSARDEQTQDSSPAIEDTVAMVPGDSLIIIGFIDQDNKVEATSFVDGPETNDSSSSQIAFIERQDTAYFRLRVQNTGNGAETFVIVLNVWDTNPTGTGNEGNSQVVDNFRVSFTRTTAATAVAATNDTEGGALANTILGGGGTADYPAQIYWDSQTIAPGADTYLWLRVAANSQARTFDTIGLTVWFYADTSVNRESRTAYDVYRFNFDSGYAGDNDTVYAQGGSQDSISVFVEVAEAVVRVHKSETVWAPKTYTDVMGALGNFDIVPGATILYEIIYDNDGNRGADSITIIDMLPAEVDLKIDSFVNGIDTDLVHTRYMNQSSNWDTSVNINLSTRGDSENFNDSSVIAFTGAAYTTKICDSVAGVKITFNGTSNQSRLLRDNGNDQLETADGGTLDGSGINKTGARSDSGDVGIIRLAVVIR